MGCKDRKNSRCLTWGFRKQLALYIHHLLYKYAFILKETGSMNKKADIVERQVISVELNDEPGRAVVSRRLYATDIEDLWDAIVNPERLSRWFLPISGDLRLGGKYQLEGNAGGTIKECEKPSLLAVTWEMHGDIGWLNVKLEPHGEESTLLTLEHIGLDKPEYLAFWAQFGPGALGVGWDLGLIGLDEHIAGITESAIQDENEWVQTEEGSSRVRQFSDAWVQAAINFGTDPEVASKAGVQTFAFYTGTEAP